MTSDEVPLLVTLPSSDPPLDSFLSIDLAELTSTIRRSGQTTCLLDPIPTKLFKDFFPLIRGLVFDQIKLSFTTGYVSRPFKIAVIRPLLKKPLLDFANYRQRSNLPFISKILERLVVSRLTDHLNINSLIKMVRSGF